MSENQFVYASPLVWIPTGYLAMGLIYSTVSAAANVMFFNFGMTMAEAAFWSSFLVWPYVVKPLWAPAVELYRTKKFFVLSAQALIVILLICLAFLIRMPWSSSAVPAIILLGIVATVGATQDIATDGVYVTTLGPAQQATYIGFQSMCWSAGPVLAGGVLLRVSGMLHDPPEQWGDSWLINHVWRPMLEPMATAAHTTGDWGHSWMVVLLAIAGLIGALAVCHVKFLPTGEKARDAPRSMGDAVRSFRRAFAAFFEKKDVVSMIAFAFLFRFGYGLLEKSGPLFMKDDVANGGLGLSNQIVGDIIGTYGAGAFMAGSVLGGVLVAKWGLWRARLPLCLCMNLPNAAYVYLSHIASPSYSLIAWLVSIEKFFCGCGAAGLMIYLMQQVAPGRYRTAHLAFGSAIMGLNMMFTGMISGSVAQFFGYKTFFVLVLIVASIPSALATFVAPFNYPDTTGSNADRAR